MRPEAWALAGVVVGALVGGLAQVVALLIEARSRREHEDRQLRRQAYFDFQIATRTALVMLNRVNHQAGDDGKGHVNDDDVDRLISSRDKTEDALAILQLFCPEDTFLAARALDEALIDYSDSIVERISDADKTLDMTPIKRARKRFVRLAKRDMRWKN